MAIANLYSRFLWYSKKHGLPRLILLGLQELWRIINNKEVVFLFDLASTPLETCKGVPVVTVRAYDLLENIPKDDMDQLIQVKGKENVASFLEFFFKRRATLWIAKMGGQIVGYHWTLIGGFDGFYSMPITSRDGIVVAVEIFPQYRGHGIASALRMFSFAELRKQGILRVFAKVHVSNASGLRSMAKNGSQVIGKVRTFKIMNKHLTIWG